jgi:hypothetical protein
MYKKLTILILLLTTSLFASTNNKDKQQKNIDGYYERTDNIIDMFDGSYDDVKSYVNIKKVNNNYEVDGLIYGGNFHKCTISNTNEMEYDKKPTLTMRRDKNSNSLSYFLKDKKHNIDCHLRLSIRGDALTIKDDNGDCRQYLGFCGSRASLDRIVLYKNKGDIIKEYKIQSVYEYISASNKTYEIYIEYKYHHKLNKQLIDKWDYGIVYYIFIKPNGLNVGGYEDGILTAVTKDVLDKSNLKLLNNNTKTNISEDNFEEWEEDYFSEREYIQPQYNTTLDDIIEEAIKQKNKYKQSGVDSTRIIEIISNEVSNTNIVLSPEKLADAVKQTRAFITNNGLKYKVENLTDDKLGKKIVFYMQQGVKKYSIDNFENALSYAMMFIKTPDFDDSKKIKDGLKKLSYFYDMGDLLKDNPKYVDIILMHNYNDFILYIVQHLRENCKECITEYTPKQIKQNIDILLQIAKNYELKKASDLVAFVAIGFDLSFNFHKQKDINTILLDMTISSDKKWDILMKKVSDEAWEEADKL